MENIRQDIKECSGKLTFGALTGGRIMSGFSAAACVVKLTCDVVLPLDQRPECLKVGTLMQPGGMVGALIAGIALNADAAFEGGDLGNAIFDLPKDLVSMIEWASEIPTKLEILREKLKVLDDEKNLRDLGAGPGRLTDDPRETSPAPGLGELNESDTYVA